MARTEGIALPQESRAPDVSRGSGITDPAVSRIMWRTAATAALQRRARDGTAAIVAASPPRACAGRRLRISAGIKWKTVLGAAAAQKFSSATPMKAIRHLLDRMVMEGTVRPVRRHDHRARGHRRHARLHYLRWEYPECQGRLERRSRRRPRPATGEDIRRQRQEFPPRGADGRRRLHLRRGTSLLESLEGNAARCASSRRCRRCRPLRQATVIQQRASPWPPFRSFWTAAPITTSAFRHGPVTRHAADSADRKHQARGASWKGLRINRCASCLYDSAAAL